MVDIGDKALLFRNRDMMWLEESASPSVGDKGFLIQTDNGNFFLKETSVSVGNKGRLFNINKQYYLRSAISVTEPGKFKWRVNCSNAIHGIKVTSDGTIFVGTEWDATNGAIWAINSNSTIKWCNNDDILPTDNPDYYADLAISSDETGLFIGDTWGYLRRFNIANGTEVWNWSRALDSFYGGLVIDSGDNIYGGSDTQGIVSMDKDGNFRWGNSTVGGIDYQLALDNNQLYVPQILPCNVSNQSKSYNYSWGDGYSAIDLNSGEINWIAGREMGYAIEYYNNRAYYGTLSELDCVTTGGGLTYRYNIDVYVEDIIVDTNDNCYLFEGRTNYSNCIKKIDSNGNLIWVRNMTKAHCIQFGTHAMVKDSDNLYIATDTWGWSGRAAFSIKLSDGSVNWSYPLTYDSGSGGALSPSQDTFYFGSGQYLYAIEI